MSLGLRRQPVEVPAGQRAASARAPLTFPMTGFPLLRRNKGVPEGLLSVGRGGSRPAPQNRPSTCGLAGGPPGIRTPNLRIKSPSEGVLTDDCDSRCASVRLLVGSSKSLICPSSASLSLTVCGRLVASRSVRSLGGCSSLRLFAEQARDARRNRRPYPRREAQSNDAYEPGEYVSDRRDSRPSEASVLQLGARCDRFRQGF
jgi:hypothetical protein